METLVTSRLVMRFLKAEDLSFALEGLNDLAVVGWLSTPPYPYMADDFTEFLDTMAEPGATWAITAGGEFCGVISLQRGKFGYWLLQRWHGRGIMSEAAEAVLAAHFAAGGGAVSSGYFEGNLASARVLEKLGFREVGRESVFCLPLGRERPHVSLRLDPPAEPYAQ